MKDMEQKVATYTEKNGLIFQNEQESNGGFVARFNTAAVLIIPETNFDREEAQKRIEQDFDKELAKTAELLKAVV